MSEAFDIYNLIFLALAVFIFLRLRSVLGRRTGNERKPFDPYSAPDTSASHNADKDKHIATTPTHPELEQDEAEAAEATPDWSDIAPEGSSLAKGLEAIYSADPSFDPREFLEGAKQAYEMIVVAFAENDRATLKNLLSAEVFDSFGAVLDERETRDETVEMKFIGTEKANIIEAALNKTNASVTIKFQSELISATRASDGKVIDGDPKRPREVIDIWTFMRDVTSRDPNWKLVATEAAN